MLFFHSISFLITMFVKEPETAATAASENMLATMAAMFVYIPPCVNRYEVSLHVNAV